jgi:hypothetical protein
MDKKERSPQNKPRTKTVRITVELRDKIRAFAAYKKFTMIEAVNYIIRNALVHLNEE